jgi:hypothetical protein
MRKAGASTQPTVYSVNVKRNALLLIEGNMNLLRHTLVRGSTIMAVAVAGLLLGGCQRKEKVLES